MNRASHHRLVRAARIVALGLVVLAGTAQGAPPVLTVPGAQTVSESQLLEFSVSATDPEGQSLLLYTDPLPPGATFRDNGNNTGLFSWTPDPGQAGSYSITFYADDTFGGIDSKSVAIDVVEANQAPILNPIGDRTVERGALLIASLDGYDPDGDAVAYTTVDLPSFGTLTDNGDGTGSLSFAPTSATPTGTYTLTVILSDGSLEVSETFGVTVTASSAGSPPSLAPIGNQTVTEGSSSAVSLSATDPDGDLLTWTVSLPGFANLVVTGSLPGSSTARLDLTPGFCDAGPHPASLTVSDGAWSDSEAFTIVVQDLNREPVWQAPAGGYALALDAGTSSALNVAALDPDQTCGGAAPTLSISGSGAGDALHLTLEDLGNGAGVLHVEAAAGASGAFQVQLRASDRLNPALFRETTVAVTVRSAGTNPAARAWFERDPVRLDIGRPRERVYLEPVQGTFALEAVVLSSIRLRAWPGAGSVPEIAPLAERFAFGGDRDQNGAAELRMEFGKEDLRALLSNLPGRIEAPLTLEAALADGRHVTASLSLDVVPERVHAIRRLGPNPLNPEAVLTVELVREGRLRVRVFDLAGRLVRTLLDEASVPAGDHDVRFDGRSDSGAPLPSGRYFVRVDVPDGTDAQSITVLK